MTEQVDEQETSPDPVLDGAASDSEPPAVTVPTGDVSRAHLKGLIEALVFASDHPLTVGDIAKAAGRADKKLVRSLCDEIRQEYSRRGFHFEEVGGGFSFRTSAVYAPFLRDMAAKKPVRMTRAQLETLAIVSYRQPITRPEIDDVRGVDSGPVMKMLLDRDLIRILGKKDEPGRPLLYGTTPTFLEFFGLKSLKDLPSLREFTELSDDSKRIYEREMEASGEETAEADVGTLASAAAAVTEQAAEADEHREEPREASSEPTPRPEGEPGAPAPENELEPDP